jgi:cytochrome b
MTRDIPAWDPLVRASHWIIVAVFAVAYFTEDDLLSAHVWVGYVVGVVVALRVVWGFFGPQRARFSGFVHGPAAVSSYLFDFLWFRAKRSLGHRPAGGPWSSPFC